MRTIDKPGVLPIRHLLLDPSITEIMINGPHQIFVERGGLMSEVKGLFTSPAQLEQLVDNLIGPTGRAVTARSPMVDFRLEDGSRVNICIAPISLHGATLTIRKFTRSIRSLEDLVARGTLTTRMARFLALAVRARLNLVFSGGTGSGKTTLLGVLAGCVGPRERIVVIEDTAELDLSLPHCVRLECRPPNLEGSGGVPLGELLRNSLRMRPDRILVGEIRGDEAFEMVHAMSSGHDGSMGVLHASTPAHAIGRLELMLLSRGLSLPLWAIQKQMAASLDLVIQHAIMPDGVRRVTHVTEVSRAENDEVVLQDLFTYRLHGFDPDGRAVGEFVSTGVRPKFHEKLRLAVGEDEVASLLAPGPA
ncbi:MAG: Flp pilus assembly complex ATPase component TadA [Sandaracinaceae bacterium]|nr:Flp pilus assembly complex ATPase component TadA [Sandaracinaceae bacterium]